MERFKELDMRRALRWRYVVAVALIAALSTGALLTQRSSIKDTEYTAFLVNVSGRQRMLSQRVALYSHRLTHARYGRRENVPVELAAVTALAAAMETMGDANRQLSTGVFPDRTVAVSKELQGYYFGEVNLAARVEQYLGFVKEVLDAGSEQQAKLAVAKIDERTDALLRDLNAVVSQYQREGEARLVELQRLELLVWIVTLFTLILEVLFIFKPMARMVLLFASQQANLLDNLQDLVAQRTKKLQQANQKLQEMASRDPLTNLKNRLTMEQDIEALLERFHKNRADFALAMIDIDWFKQVNDEYGHAAGDFVLTELSQLLRDELREYDEIYRTGGEEFVLLINRIGMSEAVEKLQKLRIAVAEHMFIFEARNIPLTISGGLYHTHLNSVGDVHDLLKRVDEALYSAKHAGRNQIHVVQRGNAKESFSA